MLTIDMGTVAFYGAGMLGSNFVKALRRRGIDVNVWNRTFDKAQALEADGARAFRDAADAARGASRIHICVRDDASVDAILDQILPAVEKGTPIIDHTTVLPAGVVERAKRLRDAGHVFLHAPVFMGPPNALDGTGVMMTSGPKATFEALRADLEAMTGELRYFGERVDLAAAYKLMGNAMILAVVGGLADVFRIADTQEITREDAYTLFSFFNPAGQIGGRGRRMAQGDYDPTWTLDMASKDASLMIEATKGKELAVIDAVARELDNAKAQGLGSKDLGAIATIG